MQRRISRICSLHSTQRRVAKWLADGLRTGREEGKLLTTCKFWAWLQCSLCVCACVGVCVCVRHLVS